MPSTYARPPAPTIWGMGGNISIGGPSEIRGSGGYSPSTRNRKQDENRRSAAIIANVNRLVATGMPRDAAEDQVALNLVRSGDFSPDEARARVRGDTGSAQSGKNAYMAGLLHGALATSPMDPLPKSSSSASSTKTPSQADLVGGRLASLAPLLSQAAAPFSPLFTAAPPPPPRRPGYIERQFGDLSGWSPTSPAGYGPFGRGP